MLVKGLPVLYSADAVVYLTSLLRREKSSTRCSFRHGGPSLVVLLTFGPALEPSV